MIITLCGSMRFHQDYVDAYHTLSLRGISVFTVACLGICPGHSDEEKQKLDQLHLRKIDVSDGILVLDRGGYIGQSTAGEIVWARQQHKQVFWLEPCGHMLPADGGYGDLANWIPLAPQVLTHHDQLARVEIGAYYRHYGNTERKYRVIDIATSKEPENDGQQIVLYEEVGERVNGYYMGKGFYTRTFKTFTAVVEHNGVIQPRFTKI